MNDKIKDLYVKEGVSWYVDEYHFPNYARHIDGEISFSLGSKNEAVRLCKLLNEMENERKFLRLELDTHKHPLWSTREAERKVKELEDEIEMLKQGKKDIEG